jgi:hypothetical protein
LIGEVAFHEEDDSFAMAISEIEGFHSKVMWAFLEKKAIGKGPACFFMQIMQAPHTEKSKNPRSKNVVLIAPYKGV